VSAEFIDPIERGGDREGGVLRGIGPQTAERECRLKARLRAPPGRGIEAKCALVITGQSARGEGVEEVRLFFEDDVFEGWIEEEAALYVVLLLGREAAEHVAPREETFVRFGFAWLSAAVAVTHLNHSLI
jgi:hypothetical protein